MFIWYLICDVYRKAEENRELLAEILGVVIFLLLGILFIPR